MVSLQIQSLEHWRKLAPLAKKGRSFPADLDALVKGAEDGFKEYKKLREGPEFAVFYGKAK